MNRLTIERSLDSPVGRVWEIVGKPGSAPGPGIRVTVERPGAPDGTGMIRSVKVGPATVQEEITSVGPGPVIAYRVTKGAPVRDYASTLALADSEKESTRVSWDVCFRPVVPGTGWVISLATKHMLNRVLDEVALRLSAGRAEGSE